MIVAPLLCLVPLGPMILNMWDLDIYCKDVTLLLYVLQLHLL